MKRTRNRMVTTNGCVNNEPLPFMLLFIDYFQRRFYRKHLEPQGLNGIDIMLLCMVNEYKDLDGLMSIRTLEVKFKYFWKGRLKTKLACDTLITLGYLVVEGRYIRLSESGIKLVLTYNTFVIELVDRKYSMFFRERKR